MVDANPYGPVVRGLRRYLRQICQALAVGPEASCWDLDDVATAYIALDGRLPGYPNHDLALIWDEENGWAAALETTTGDDLIVLSYLGVDVLPPARLVSEFVAELRADRYPGQPEPPEFRVAFADDGLAGRLSRYASAIPNQRLTGAESGQG
jgi:Family of unknown function (DUF6292)